MSWISNRKNLETWTSQQDDGMYEDTTRRVLEEKWLVLSTTAVHLVRCNPHRSIHAMQGNNTAESPENISNGLCRKWVWLSLSDTLSCSQNDESWRACVVSKKWDQRLAVVQPRLQIRWHHRDMLYRMFTDCWCVQCGILQMRIIQQRIYWDCRGLRSGLRHRYCTLHFWYNGIQKICRELKITDIKSWNNFQLNLEQIYF